MFFAIQYDGVYCVKTYNLFGRNIFGIIFCVCVVSNSEHFKFEACKCAARLALEW